MCTINTAVGRKLLVSEENFIWLNFESRFMPRPGLSFPSLSLFLTCGMNSNNAQQVVQTLRNTKEVPHFTKVKVRLDRENCILKTIKGKAIAFQDDISLQHIPTSMFISIFISR